ncbi:GNAT family N-acetyltransferase [Pantoea sp.]|uniref:GNAT family N-acetyltransferase n=1 Tax=Pantoea sp. TaxID=69393 RepID=UPI0031D8F1FE
MQLETTRLRLEPFQHAHFDGLRAMENDPEIMRYISNGKVKTPEETRETIERVMQRWQQYGFSWWAICEKESDEVVGAACLQHLANQDGAPLEIGWRLNANHHGKGFATEAAQAIVQFAVEQIGVNYLVAVADPENQASQKVMQRLGMKHKGIETHYDVPCVVYELSLAQS